MNLKPAQDFTTKTKLEKSTGIIVAWSFSLSFQWPCFKDRMGFVEVFLFPCFDLVLVFQPIPMSLSIKYFQFRYYLKATKRSDLSTLKT